MDKDEIVKQFTARELKLLRESRLRMKKEGLHAVELPEEERVLHQKYWALTKARSRKGARSLRINHEFHAWLRAHGKPVRPFRMSYYNQFKAGRDEPNTVGRNIITRRRHGNKPRVRAKYRQIKKSPIVLAFTPTP